MSKINPIEAKKISIYAKLNSQQSENKKTVLKSWRGDVCSFEHYFNVKEQITLAKVDLKLKDLPLETAEKIIDIILPLFENPYEQQELKLKVNQIKVLEEK